MNELVEFIRDRIAEDEQAALATTPVPVAGEWRAVRDKHADDDAPLALIQGQDEYGPPYDDYSWGVPVIVLAAEWEDEAEANLRHIERWCPARALRAVEAKRRSLAAVEPFATPDYSTDGEAVAYGVLCAMASEWETHPDYQEAWKP